MNTKTLKQNITIATAIIISIFGFLFVCNKIGEFRTMRADLYAIEHNCEWHYSYYLNEEPICK